VVEGVKRKLTKCQGVRKMTQQCVSEESIEMGDAWMYACTGCSMHAFSVH
jgi:hypothetical protein